MKGWFFMKKILIILLFVGLIFYMNQKDYNITEDSIRFRVIANSNSPKDILMKELVVSKISNILFINNNSVEEAENNIYNNLNKVELIIENLFNESNYDKKFNISYGLNEIPEKTFMGKKYNKGLYKSLVIEIGEAKGDNYFCILYPSLCLIDYSEKEKTEYKYRIKDLIDKAF